MEEEFFNAVPHEDAWLRMRLRQAGWTERIAILRRTREIYKKGYRASLDWAILLARWAEGRQN